MLATLTILLPLFGLIAAGYGARRLSLLDGHAASVLNAFVVWLALPALLFDITAHSSWAALWQPGFVGAFGLATAMIFATVFLVRLRAGRPMADASVEAVAASYSNTGYVGLPLCLLVFGRGSQVEATIATLIVVCVLFSVAIVLIELGLQGGERSRAGRVGAALWRSLKHPLVLSPLLGAAWSGTGVALPAVAHTFLQLLGQAATPCALVALGVFLADCPVRRADRGTAWALVAVKLLALPGLTWWLANHVFMLPPHSADAAVLLAALPTGTGPFMLAEFYRRDVGVSSTTTLVSTVLSLGTLAVVLTQLR
ncbi:AEC family transporter [Roseateles sp. L2-2]|uniref:AEC family transporter n=1 Tax=Roseateles TaxID=93681 RepID=UPI003D364A1D